MFTTTQKLLIVSFLDTLSAGLIMPKLAPQVRSLGASPMIIGIMFSLYSAFQLISSPITGSLSDIKGRKPILALTLCICGISYFMLGLTSSIAVFLVLRSILGLFKQTQLLTKALAPDYEIDPQKKARMYGRLVTLSGAGMTVGPIISGHVLDASPYYGFTILTTATAIIFAINLRIIKTLPQEKLEKQNKKKKNEENITTNIIESIKSNLKQSIQEFCSVDWKIFWDVFLLKFLITLAFGVYFSNFAIFLRFKHQVSSTCLGYITAFKGAVGSLCSYFINYINVFYTDDKDFTKRNLHIFLLLTISFLGLLLSPSLPLFIVFLVPLAICGAVGRVVSLEMTLNRSDESQRGTVMGASSSFRSISGVIAPLIAGVVGEFVGIMYVMYVSVFFSVIGTIVIYNIRSNIKNKKE